MTIKGNVDFEKEKILEKEKAEKSREVILEKLKENEDKKVERSLGTGNIENKNLKVKNKRVGKKSLKKKKIGVRNFVMSRKSNDKISQLEKEIERNWEVLGRDRNGNILG